MQRSTKDAWLRGPGDLRTAEVQDVPNHGESVLVRGLPAKYAADVQGQLKLVQEGNSQVAKIDIAAMELLQFVHGCIEPEFTHEEAAEIQMRYGPAFRKVIAKIDELSGIDKEAIEATEQRFPDSGAVSVGADGDSGVAAGNGGPAVPVRVGA